MSAKNVPAATAGTVPYLPRCRDPIAREVAITWLLEDIANALARVARVLGVPQLATLASTRDVVHTRKTYRARPSAKQLQGMAGPGGPFGGT